MEANKGGSKHGSGGKDASRKVKLLEEIPTAAAAKTGAQKQSQLISQTSTQPGQAKPTIEDLQSMIMNKLVQLESTHADDEPAAATQDSQSKNPAKPAEQSELLSKLEEIVNNSDLDNQKKVEELYKYYTDIVAEELKNTYKLTLQHKLQEELLDYQSQVLLVDHFKKSQLILQKYEILTREYQNQNKSLKENHERIITQEQSRRGEIISNFQSHLTSIKAQIKEDTDKFVQDGGGEIHKENAELLSKYEELKKEIEEKSKLMDEQIEEKEKGSNTIEEEMSKKIGVQQEEIVKQIELYKEQTKIKEGEEAELVKVLADYKKKYEEFTKAMKKSRETFKVYEGEIKNMNQRAQELTQLKKKLTTGDAPTGKKKKGGAAKEKDFEAMAAETEKMKKEWESERYALYQEKETLTISCKELQEQIKALKEQQQAQA